MTVVVTNLTTIVSVFLVTYAGFFKSRVLFKLALFLFVISVFDYFLRFGQIEETKYGSSVNAAYSMIYILFMLCVNGFNRKTNLLFFAIFCLVILSAKRGAIICMMLVSLSYILYRYAHKLKTMVFIIPFALLLLYGVTQYIYTNSVNLQTKVEGTMQGNSSGREYMNEVLWLHFLHSSTQDQIFGYQFGGSISLLGIDAHNDWLEILIGQGLVGVILYIMLLINLWYIYVKKKRYLKNYERFIVVTSLVIWLIKSYISQTVYGGDHYMFAITYGYIIAQGYIRKKILIDETNKGYCSRHI